MPTSFVALDTSSRRMLTELIVWMNQLAGALAGVVLAPIAWLPGWISATAIAAVTGILMLVMFKYTSHQAEIRRTRNRIKANLLALSLFRDDMWVGLRCQGSLLLGAGKLLTLALVPMLVMVVPMCLLLGQLALWFQARPLTVGEEAVVTVHLATREANRLSGIELTTSSAISPRVGPVRVPAKDMVCWKVAAAEPGCHALSFELNGQAYTKELAVGDGFMPTSLKRPARSVTEILLHPREEPFSRGSPVQSIEVAYPSRSSWTTGSRSWLLFWFAASMVAAFIARPLLKVNM